MMIKRHVLDERMKKMAVADSFKIAKLALICVIAIQTVFIVAWFIPDNPRIDGNIPYLLNCLVCLAVSAYSLYYLVSHDKIEQFYNSLYRIEMAYAIYITVWSVLSIFINTAYGISYGFLIYASVIMLVPSIIYIDENIYNIAQIIVSILLVSGTYLMNPDRYQLNVVNFLCFSFLSLIAVRLNSYTKRTSIKRQIDTEDSSRKDGLTGVYNRQTLNNMADEIVRQNFIKQTKLSAAMIDVDDFKKFNDVYGHKIGDEVLKNTVAVFRKEIEENGGMLFRYGGEEFMAIFSNMEMNEVCSIMERGQSVLKTIKPGEDIKPVTVSIGIYTATPSRGDRRENFFSQADKLMYKSKAKGKDCYTAKEKKEVKLKDYDIGGYK